MDDGVLAIIPARGGSKEIPRKNLADMGGAPLVAWSISAARSAACVTRTIVSTDDPEIADVSRQWGAEVIERPAEISGDEATSESALINALETLRESENYRPGLVVFLQATSPFRAPDDIDRALKVMIAENADSLFSARAIEGFVWRGKETGITPVDYDPRNRPRRQDVRERNYEENGSIYIFLPAVLEKDECRLGGRIAVYEMPAVHSHQVDDPEDMVLMRELLAAGLVDTLEMENTG